MDDDTGRITPGALTGVSGRCCLRFNEAAATFFSYGGAVVENRDEAEEAKRSSQRGAAEFPGIVESWSPFENSSIKTGYGGRPAWRQSRQLRRDGKLDEDKA